MTSSSQANHQTKDQTDAPVAPDFAAEVQTYWEKNRALILILCAAVLVGIVGYEGWGYLNTVRDQNARDEYAKAVGSPERLAGFASEHSGHALAPVALLQLADTKFAAGDYPAALTNYQKAVLGLTNSTLKSRAQLGAAVSQLSAGDQKAAEVALKSLSADSAADKMIRAEAAYHFATLANEAGRTDEARQSLDQATTIDPTGIWAQRAMQLRASMMGAGDSVQSLKVP